MRTHGSQEKTQKAVDTIVAETQRMASIVRRLGEITQVETLDYVGGEKIADLSLRDEEQ